MAELTAEERRRNVQRVEDVEKNLDQIERMALALVYQSALIMRRINEQRGVLREVFGKEPPEELPPLTVAAERLAGEVVIIEAGRRP